MSFNTVDVGLVPCTCVEERFLIDLNLGEGETATVYTCDFGYVRINAEHNK